MTTKKDIPDPKYKIGDTLMIDNKDIDHDHSGDDVIVLKIESMKYAGSVMGWYYYPGKLPKCGRMFKSFAELWGISESEIIKKLN